MTGNSEPIGQQKRHQARNHSLQAYGHSDTGQKREANEDSYFDLEKTQQAGSPVPPQLIQQKGYLWIVADGMGGHVGGKQASSLAVNQIMAAYYQDADPNPMQRLANAVYRANAAVHGYAQEHPDLQGMGSTVVATALYNGTLHLVWVGDSRAYLLRDGLLQQQTEDHSWVGQAVKQGTITKEEAASHPNRSVILRSIGAKPQVEPQFQQIPTRPGDIYLLCSDGLTGVVSDDEIRQVLQASRDPKTAVNQLIALANQRGGPDNITVAVIGLDAFKGVAAAKSNYLPLMVAGLLLALVVAVIGFLALNSSSSSIPYSPKVILTPPVKADTTLDVESGQQALAQTTDTLTPTLSPTDTPPLSPTLPPVQTTPTPTPTLITATPTKPAVAPSLLISPTLLLPPPGETAVVGKLIKFQWQWLGTLPPDMGFEVRIWRPGDPDGEANHPGAYNAEEYAAKGWVRTTGNGMYEVDIDVKSAAGFKQNGIHLWTVALVRLRPSYERIGLEATPRELVIAIPGGPGGDKNKNPDNGGGGNNNPPPPGT